MTKLLTIGSAAKFLDVSVSTLRDWERAGRLVLTRKDRLLRFGTEDTRVAENLAINVLSIITMFSTRQYGSRSRRNQSLIDGVTAAIKEAQCS